MGLAFGLAHEHLPNEKVTVGASMIGASAVIAGSLASALAGFLVDQVWWHGIFVTATILAVGAGVL